MQLDTLLGGGGQWVCDASARAVPQTDSILHARALLHRGYQCRSKYGRENQQFRSCLLRSFLVGD